MVCVLGPWADLSLRVLNAVLLATAIPGDKNCFRPEYVAPCLESIEQSDLDR